MSEQGRKYDSVLSAQHGGKHYKEKGIQPIEYAYANDLNFFQGNVVKYVTRYKDKKGVEDLKKAIHYLQMILEFEYKVLTNFSYSDEQSEDTDEVGDTNDLWYPPVEDGGNPWIEYDGNGQPVSDEVVVEVMCGHERGQERWGSSPRPSGYWFWTIEGDDEDIVAYRIVG